MSWDSIKESSDGEFIKIEAGKQVRLHILPGEPDHRVNHFDSKATCTGPGCLVCAKGEKKSQRWTVNVFNMLTKRTQKMEQGVTVFKQILTIRENYGGTLDAVDLVISRQGSGQNDTKYTVVPVPTQFKPEMLAAPEDAPF